MTVMDKLRRVQGALFIAQQTLDQRWASGDDMSSWQMSLLGCVARATEMVAEAMVEIHEAQPPEQEKEAKETEPEEVK